MSKGGISTRVSTENRLLKMSLSKRSSAMKVGESRVNSETICKTPKEEAVKINDHFSDLINYGAGKTNISQDISFKVPERDDRPILIPKLAGCQYNINIANKQALVLSVMESLSPLCLPSTMPIKIKFFDLLMPVTQVDPEFILKTALFCRNELQIRLTTNFILAYAGAVVDCRPYLSKYFSSAIKLPSDWLQILEISLSFNSLPAEIAQKYFIDHGLNARNHLSHALRKVMVEKFSEFDEYQLAKYSEKSSAAKDGSICTLKNMIRLLHISKPVNHVLSILGKKYPSSVSEFMKLGLPGEFCPNLVGMRMSLPVPYTWETELSASKGYGKQEIWQRLIESGKLPYMAMLRNLRNLLIEDISDKHLNQVINKLTGQREVASSKQLPFQFLNAFDSLCQLSLGNGPSFNFRNRFRNTSDRPTFDRAKLRLLKNAVETALDLSIRLNLPAVPGSTLIIVHLDRNEKENKQLLCLFMCMMVCEHYDAYIEIDKNLYNVKDFESLMPKDYSILLTVENVFRIFDADSRSHLKRLKPKSSEVKTLSLGSLYGNIISGKKKYNSLLVLGCLDKSIHKFTETYLELVGPLNCLCCGRNGLLTGWLSLNGFSDSIIRILKHVGNHSLLNYVETTDRRVNLPSTLSYKTHDPTTLVVADKCRMSLELPAILSNGGRTAAVQVFVSSTFRDMSAERDLISGLVFPALRKQLSLLDYPVLLNEIDLRWGVPETCSENGENLRLCLEKVVTSDYLILLLGERYGWTPTLEIIRTLPPKLLDQIMKFYEEGMSITEIETRLFYQLNYNKGKNLLCFIRDRACLRQLNSDMKKDFVEPSTNSKNRLKSFKTFLQENGLIHLNAYPVAIDDKSMPVVGNLEVLGEALFTTLYNLISDQVSSNHRSPIEIDGNKAINSTTPVPYLDAIAASVSPRHLQEVLRAFVVDLPARGAQVRRVRLAGTRNCRNTVSPALLTFAGMKRGRDGFVARDGGLLCLLGAHGSGKTTLICAIATVLSNPNWTPLASCPSNTTHIPDIYRRPSRVFVHLTLGAYTSTTRHAGLLLAAIPQMTQLKQLLDTWISRIVIECKESLPDPYTPISKRLKIFEEEMLLSATQESDLVRTVGFFHKLLRIVGECLVNHYIFIVDSVDHLVPNNLEWIPDIIPENVKFIFSMDGDSKVAANLATRPDVIYLRLTELALHEKVAAIRCYFAQYGKVLSESGLGNQLMKLARKMDAGTPLYLKMACDELRLYSSFSNLDSNLQSLPQRLPELVTHIIARASVCCGEGLVKTALACISCSRNSLFPAQLQRMINIWLFATQEDCPSQLFEFMFGTEVKISQEESATSSPVICTLALHILLSQLQPLLEGLESIDESATVVAGQADEVIAPSLYNSGGLRIRSSDVREIVRRMCFSLNTPINRFSASRRLGYLKNNSTPGSELPVFSKSPTEIQTYRLLLYEHLNDLRDQVYYAFHAKKIEFAISTLSDFGYVKQKALNNDIPGLLEELMGFETSDPDTKIAWQEAVEHPQNKDFREIRQFVQQSAVNLSQFPELTGQFLIDCFPGGPKEVPNKDKKKFLSNIPWVTERYNCMSSNCHRNMDACWRPEAVSSPTALASDGDQLIACGDRNGSITLLNMSSGKVLNTFYGHTGAVNDLVFIRSDSKGFVSKGMLLFSVSEDATSCVWKLVPSVDSLIGLKLSSISGQHIRSITACAWEPQRWSLTTAGLDGKVHVYDIRPSVGEDVSGSINTACGFDLTSFKMANRSYSTNHQPINAMVLVEGKIVVGCWNGLLWTFDSTVLQKDQNPTRTLIGSVYGLQSRDVRHDSQYLEKWGSAYGLHAAITALSYSGPQAGVIASADYAGQVLLLDAASLRCVLRLQQPSARITSRVSSRLCFVPKARDGGCKLALTGGSTSVSSAISVWDINKARTMSFHGSLTIGVSIAVQRGVATILGTLSGGIFVKSSNDESNIRCICPSHKTHASPVQALDCHIYDNSRLFVVCGTGRGDVTFVNSSTGVTDKNSTSTCSFWPHSIGQQEVGGGEAGGTLSVSISIEGGFVVSGGGKGDCHFYKIATALISFGTPVRDIFLDEYRVNAHSSGVSALATSKNITVSGGKDGLLAVYKFDEMNAHQPLVILTTQPRAHRDWITCLAVKCKDTNEVLIVSGGNDQCVVIWSLVSDEGNDLIDLSRIWTIEEHMKPVIRVLFDTNYMVSVSSDGIVVVWDLSSSLLVKLRKFTLEEFSENDRLVMLDFGSDTETSLSEETSESSISSNSTVEDYGFDVLFGEDVIMNEKPKVCKNNESGCTVFNEKKFSIFSKTYLSVACVGKNDCCSLRDISLFEPQPETSFMGHPKANLSRPIQLTSVGENGAIVSASTTSNQLAGEICLWKFDKKHENIVNPTEEHSGSIIAIKERNGIILVASDDGSISIWRANDGQQLGMIRLQGSTWDEPITAFDATVSIDKEQQKIQIFASSGSVLQCISLAFDTTGHPPSYTTTSERYFLPGDVFSVVSPQRLCHSEVVFGTSNGDCLVSSLLDLPKKWEVSDYIEPIISLCRLVDEEEESDNQYIGLYHWSIVRFNSSGQRIPESLSDYGGRLNGLQVVHSHSNKHFIFSSGTEKSKPAFSFVRMYNNATEFSQFKLPQGIDVTAFSATVFDRTSKFLVILAGSDGIIRYVSWPMNGEPKLEALLPTGREITQICASGLDHYTVGYRNGDVGIFKFFHKDKLLCIA